MDQTVTDGRITFAADEAAVARCNIRLRTADRILLKIASFEARDFDELFDATKELPWADWLPKSASFPVRGKSVRSQLHHVPTCQAMVKKAIVEQLKSKYNVNWFAEVSPEIPIEVSILKDRATLSLDTSGKGLHKRGYRTLGTDSPLRETLSAGMVLLSYWNKDRTFVDPFCGSGTIAIEAAMIGRNIAPGIKRDFLAEKWPAISQRYWSEAREEANDLCLASLEIPLIATDRNSEVLKKARYHARQAGVFDEIHFQQKEFSDFTTQRKFGCVISNPPYGERTGSKQEVEELYRMIGQKFRPLETWSIYVLTSHEQFEGLYGKQAARRRKLYNGKISCTFYQYAGLRPPKRKGMEKIP